MGQLKDHRPLGKRWLPTAGWMITKCCNQIFVKLLEELIIQNQFLLFFQLHSQHLIVVVVKSLNPMDYSTPGFPVLHYLPEFA